MSKKHRDWCPTHRIDLDLQLRDSMESRRWRDTQISWKSIETWDSHEYINVCYVYSIGSPLRLIKLFLWGDSFSKFAESRNFMLLDNDLDLQDISYVSVTHITYCPIIIYCTIVLPLFPEEYSIKFHTCIAKRFLTVFDIIPRKYKRFIEIWCSTIRGSNCVFRN